MWYIIAGLAGAIVGVVIGEFHGVHMNPSTETILRIARENNNAGYKDGVRMASMICGNELVLAVKKKLEEEETKASIWK